MANIHNISTTIIVRLLYINTCTLKMRWFDQTIIRSYFHLHHCIICSLDYWTSAVPVQWINA